MRRPRLHDPGFLYMCEALTLGGMLVLVAGIGVGSLWVFILGSAMFLVGLSLSVFG